MKRIIALILSALLIFGGISVAAEATDMVPTITVETVKAQAGDTVDVEIIISNNPGICSFTLTPVYDTSMLTLKNATVSSKLGGTIEVGKNITWLSMKDSTFNGTIMTLTFEVASNIETSSIPLSVSYKKGDICNYAMEDVDFTIVSGVIDLTPAVPTIKVASNTAVLGEKVLFDVYIDDNPGICSFTLTPVYDQDILTFNGATVSSELGGTVEIGKNITWLSMKDSTYAGKLMTLEFTVSENAMPTVTEVSVSYKAGDICNFEMEDIDFTISGGELTITSGSLGDVDCDDDIDVDDLVLLRKILLDMHTPNNREALNSDMNEDQSINIIDLIKLKKYFAA